VTCVQEVYSDKDNEKLYMTFGSYVYQKSSPRKSFTFLCEI
jgi:hypothetical protein